MAGNFFRGTSVEQDGRWGKSDERLIKQMSKSGKFASLLDRKVDFEKVNIDIMSKWVGERITQLLGFEDDIVVNMVINVLQSKKMDSKKMQLEITGFLESNAKTFMEEFWTLLLDAQEQPSGIPSVFIEKKKRELQILENASAASKSTSKSTVSSSASASASAKSGSSSGHAPSSSANGSSSSGSSRGLYSGSGSSSGGGSRSVDYNTGEASSRKRSRFDQK